MERFINVDIGRNLSSAATEYISETRPAATLFWAISIIAIFALWFSREKLVSPDVPFFNSSSNWDFQWKDAKMKFSLDCKGVLAQGFKEVRLLVIPLKLH